jgi:GcrA cell cycle regulator
MKPPKPKTIADLESNDCRWPIGDPRRADFHFCGAKRAATRPYCEFHWRMAIQPPKQRQQQGVPTLPVRSAA